MVDTQAKQTMVEQEQPAQAVEAKEALQGEPTPIPPRGDWWMLALILIYGGLCAVLVQLVTGHSDEPQDTPVVQGKPFVTLRPQPTVSSANMQGFSDVATANSNSATEYGNAEEKANSSTDNRYSWERPIPPAPAATASNTGNTPTVGPETRGNVTYEPVGFDLLSSFEYAPDWSDPDVAAGRKQLPDLIPATVRAWDKKKVVLRGFMVPVDLERNRTKAFILFGNQLTCCFGKIPRFNDWVYVKAVGDRSFPAMMDHLIAVYGTFSVGEEYDQGVVSSIYRMEADEITFVRDW